MNNWVSTELELFDKTGWTNNGLTGIKMTGVMEVTHEIALMVSAYQKGIKNYNTSKLYQAVRHKSLKGLILLLMPSTGRRAVLLNTMLIMGIILHIDKMYNGGKPFIIKTINIPAENVYIRSATFNGNPLSVPKLKFKEVVKGGILVYTMGKTPNENWGIDH